MSWQRTHITVIATYTHFTLSRLQIHCMPTTIVSLYCSVEYYCQNSRDLTSLDSRAISSQMLCDVRMIRLSEELNFLQFIPRQFPIVVFSACLLRLKSYFLVFIPLLPWTYLQGNNCDTFSWTITLSNSMVAQRDLIGGELCTHAQRVKSTMFWLHYWHCGSVYVKWQHEQFTWNDRL